MDSDSKLVVCGAEARPLLTARQLLNWKRFIGRGHSYTVVDQAEFDVEKAPGHQTLVCHDMRGGYLEDS